MTSRPLPEKRGGIAGVNINTAQLVMRKVPKQVFRVDTQWCMKHVPHYTLKIDKNCDVGKRLESQKACMHYCEA